MATPVRKRIPSAEAPAGAAGRIVASMAFFFALCVAGTGALFVQVAWQASDLRCTRAADGSGACVLTRRDGWSASTRRIDLADLRGGVMDVVWVGKNHDRPAPVLMLDTAAGRMPVSHPGGGPEREAMLGARARAITAFAQAKGAGRLHLAEEFDPATRALWLWYFWYSVGFYALVWGLSGWVSILGLRAKRREAA